MGKRKRRGKKPLELTDDLITDILGRVSDKDLMRFKCASKSWPSLINTDDTYLSQLRSHRAALLDRPFLIIQKERYVAGGKTLYHNYWVELDSIEDGNPNPRQLHNPFDDCPRLIGSCEGLLVLQQRSTHKMVVLNPATKKHHVVPPSPAGDDNVVFSGFGYDHVHGCYKLVTKIKHAYNHVVELMIYNVNNCTWKKSRFEGLDDECSSQLSCPGVCVDGALYWTVERDDRLKKIICFLLAEEEFHEVDPPRFDEAMYNSIVTVFDGRLCLVCNPHDERIEFWLMECDYRGSSYSRRWINFLLVLDLERLLLSFSPRPALIPISFSACKKKILFNVDYNQLFWYDIGMNKFDKLENCINEYIHGFVEVTSCVPSLVRIGIS